MSLELPRVLVVSDSCVSTAHGTGTVMLRHFSRYPAERLGGAYFQEAGLPAWANTVRFVPQPPSVKRLSVVANGLVRIHNAVVWRLGLKPLYYNRPWAFQATVQTPNFIPQLVYSIAYSESGLALLDQVLAGLPGKPPVIQYFMDYQMPAGFGRSRYLRRALARVTEVWALTDEIATAVRPLAAAYGKEVRVQPGFHLELPARWKQQHRPVAAGNFRGIISGNFWQNSMARLVKQIWGRVQNALPGVGAIEWYCHPESARRTQAEVGSLEPEIRVAGFLSGAELLEKMIAADIAIIPFNLKNRPESDYARYSLPSRLTELLSVGLPVFCIAGRQTPLARYVNRHQLGKVCDGENAARLAARLVDFIVNQQERSLAGSAARTFAEKEFALDPFQQSLYSKLALMASENGHPEPEASTD